MALDNAIGGHGRGLCPGQQAARHLQETTGIGIFYKYGGMNLDEAVILSITDASYAALFDVSKCGKMMGKPITKCMSAMPGRS